MKTLILLLIPCCVLAQKDTIIAVTLGGDPGSLRTTVNPYTMTVTIKEPFKIDNISMTEEAFDAYILDCYKHPDTVWVGTYCTGNISVMGGNYPSPEEQKRIEKYSLGEVIDERKVDKDTCRSYGHKVPRKPSAEDFIKWRVRRLKLK